jgi:hypothetical protein
MTDTLTPVAKTARNPEPHIEPDYKSMVIMYCHDCQDTIHAFTQGYVDHEMAEVFTAADCIKMRDEIIRLRRLCGKDINSAL